VAMTAPASRRRRSPLGEMVHRPRLAVGGGQLVVAIALLVGWQLSADNGLVNPIFYSSPSRIIALLYHQLIGLQTVHGITIWDQAWVTLQEVLIGYAIGAVAGSALGFAVGRSRLLSKALEPYVLTFYAIPKISIAPLFVIILGLGLESKVAIVLMEAFFILFYNTYRGVVQVNEELVQASRIMGASNRTVLTRILLPASLPSILSGLQLAVPFAVVGAVVGEYVSSDRGLGWLVLYAGSSLDASQLFAAIVLLIAMTWLLTKVVEAIVHRLAPWLPRRAPDSVRARVGNARPT
jgi:NitT/TauT family transport system permease protein